MSFSNMQLTKNMSSCNYYEKTKNNKNMSFSNTQSTKKHVITITFMIS